HADLHLFPYTTLFRSQCDRASFPEFRAPSFAPVPARVRALRCARNLSNRNTHFSQRADRAPLRLVLAVPDDWKCAIGPSREFPVDRKSTRLNSSHVAS